MIKKIIFFTIFIIAALCLISCIKIFQREERIYFRRRERKYITKNEKIKLVKENIGVSIEFSNEIYYDIGETQYKNNYTYPYILNEVVNFLKDNEDIFLIIEGHADALAYKNKKVNYMISVNRALIAKNYIIEYIDEERIKTYAYSDTKPKYEDEKDKNRRVDFIIIENEKELKEYDNFYSNYMKDFLIEIGLTNR